jgi:hypothetical protein
MTVVVTAGTQLSTGNWISYNIIVKATIQLLGETFRIYAQHTTNGK